MSAVTLPATASPPPTKSVLVCQNRTCRKQGAAKVLAAFQASAPGDFVILGSGCLGQCGSGPMVQVLPDGIWYSRVQPAEVPAIVERHLRGGQPVKAMLYAKFHPHPTPQP